MQSNAQARNSALWLINKARLSRIKVKIFESTVLIIQIINTFFGNRKGTDRFQGYYDYTRDWIGLSAVWRPTGPFRLNVSTRYRKYDYANAFVFNDPAGGARDLDILDASLRAQYRITKRWSLWGEFEMRDQSSSDPRADRV